MSKLGNSSKDKKLELKRIINSHVYCIIPIFCLIDFDDFGENRICVCNNFPDEFKKIKYLHDYLLNKAKCIDDLYQCKEYDDAPWGYFEWRIISESLFNELDQKTNELVIRTKYGPTWGFVTERALKYAHNKMLNNKSMMAMDDGIFNILEDIGICHNPHVYQSVTNLCKDALGGSLHEEFISFRNCEFTLFSNMIFISPSVEGGKEILFQDWRLVSEEFANEALGNGEIIAQTLDSFVWCRRNNYEIENLRNYDLQKHKLPVSLYYNLFSDTACLAAAEKNFGLENIILSMKEKTSKEKKKYSTNQF